MSTSEIKNIIGLLCKQLNMIFHINLKPEHFRLAKFDKTEENTVVILWKTLSLFATGESNTDVETIKGYMASIHYSSPLFYALPGDLSVGSRELLIAISFLVASRLHNLILDQVKKSPFGDESTLIDYGNIHIQRPIIPNLSNEQDYNNFVMWIKGSIQQNQKMTKEYKIQIEKIFAKLTKSLDISTVDELCPNEVLALTSKKYCLNFLEKSSSILDLLECHQDWKRKEKVFWKWMVTVLAEREKV